jgi:hypothetical protein
MTICEMRVYDIKNLRRDTQKDALSARGASTGRAIKNRE